MSKEPHIIRLRGPWQLLLSNDADLLFEARVNVRPADQWSDSLGRSLAEFLLKNSESENPTTKVDFVLNRRFKWPSPASTPESVQLYVQSKVNVSVRMNGEMLSPQSIQSNEAEKFQELRFELLSILNATNELCLSLDRAESSTLKEQVHAVRLEVF